MKLKCPACGSPIAADQINIQAMTAVCTHCDNVFPFRTPASEPATGTLKHKAPAQVTVHEDDRRRYHLSFKWDWRTEHPAAWAVLVLAITVCLLVAAAVFSRRVSPQFVTLMLTVGWLPIYIALTVTLNRTHYQVVGDALRVWTEPLWFIAYGRKTLPLASITRIITQRFLAGSTDADSFYHVLACLEGGKQVMIARGVNYQHAHFIAQELQDVVDAAHQQPGQGDRLALAASEADVMPPLMTDSAPQAQSR
jgi:hypothetical protein